MKSNVLLGSAVGAALSVALATIAQAAPAAPPAFKSEKCYGVAKAGKNDCQTSATSCAGTSRKDGQADAWIYVPSGTCERLVGGSLEKKS
jgi:uncharacterized membrane protein